MKEQAKEKNKQREKRKKRVRRKISGTKDKPRLSIYKSNRYIYLQLIDDEEGRTLLSSCSLRASYKRENSSKNLEIARKLGEDLAKEAKNKGIKKLVLDRGHSPYHGRIKVLTEEMRKQGIKL